MARCIPVTDGKNGGRPREKMRREQIPDCRPAVSFTRPRLLPRSPLSIRRTERRVPSGNVIPRCPEPARAQACVDGGTTTPQADHQAARLLEDAHAPRRSPPVRGSQVSGRGTGGEAAGGARARELRNVKGSAWLHEPDYRWLHGGASGTGRGSSSPFGNSGSRRPKRASVRRGSRRSQKEVRNSRTQS